MRHFADVSDHQVEGLAALQDPDGLVVRQAVKASAVAFEDLVTELKQEQIR